jgi:hypothetical protein
MNKAVSSLGEELYAVKKIICFVRCYPWCSMLPISTVHILGGQYYIIFFIKLIREDDFAWKIMGYLNICIL